MRVPPDILADPAAEVVVTLDLGDRVLASRTALTTVLATAPGARVLLLLAREAYQRGERAACTALIDRAHALAPTDAEIVTAVANLLLERDPPDAAQAELVTRPFSADDAPRVLSTRSEALLRLGRLDEAEAVLWRALASVPYWPEVQERRVRLAAARQAAQGR